MMEKVCFSASADRFTNLVKMCHPPGHIDVAGEWEGLYNELMEEVFVYHYDTQKGVGKKYNYSCGFDLSVAKKKVQDANNKGRIPCYDNYKQFFESCDNYNRNLKDKYWPHKGGGFGVRGEVANTTISLWLAFFRILSTHIMISLAKITKHLICKICVTSYQMRCLNSPFSKTMLQLTQISLTA